MIPALGVELIVKTGGFPLERFELFPPLGLTPLFPGRLELGEYGGFFHR